MQKKILLFHYMGGAGGKFIANCLTFSKQVAFSNKSIASEFLKTQDIGLIEKALLSTIPSKDQSRLWLSLENGCNQLFGIGIDIVKLGHTIQDTNFTNLDEFYNNDMWLPVMSHTKSQFDNLSKFFKEHLIFSVLVDGTKEFIDCSIRKKWPQESHCLDLNLYNNFHQEKANMKFDFVFDQWDARSQTRHSEIIELANQLNINLDLNLAKHYTQKYVDFYK